MNHLSAGIPGLTANVGGTLAEAASVCLNECGLHLSVSLAVSGTPARYDLARLNVDETMTVSHGDTTKATENGACGIAILLMRQRTGLPAVLQSRKGGGYDYALATEKPFDVAARLEVSGIRQGSRSQVDTRVKQKREQTKQSDILQGDLPAYAVVVEFGTPRAVVDERRRQP